MSTIDAEVVMQVVEFEPGKFAPVVARKGEFKFTGGIVYRSHEQAHINIPREAAMTREFWEMQLADRTNAVVVAGGHHRIGSRGAGVPSSHRGFGGRTFRLRDLSTGEVTVCSDLWWQGEVPDFARPWFPDTHEFVGDGTFQ